MELRFLENKDIDLHNKLARSSLLQRWEWGEFKKENGWTPKRVAVIDKDKVVWSIQILEKKLPLGLKIAYSPYFSMPDKRIFSFFTKEARKFMKKDSIVCFTAEPLDEKSIKDFGYKKSFFSLQPKNTLILDLTKKEEEILAQTRQKGRYNIRLAQKRGVEIKEIKTAKEFIDYKNINEETAKRDKISSRPYKYLEKLFTFLSQNDLGTVFISYYQKTPIAGAIISAVGENATYMYGASSNSFRNVMAPYLVQWEAIRWAKNRGCRTYDFFGIAPENVANHKWEGITRFKKQFGGKVVSFSGPQDLVIQPFWYFILKVMSKIRKSSL